MATTSVYYALSATRRMNVSVYNKKPMVSIREYYQKDGEMKPGLKGVSLIPDQLHTLQSNIPLIDEAIAKGGHPNPVLDLSKNRKVSVSSYQGRLMVDFREYFDKDGVLTPGKKGIALTIPQWNLVKENMPLVTDAITKLS